MNEQEFNQILKKDKEQFFIFTVKLPIPFFLVKHSYIITNQKGKINRIEIWHFKNKKHPEYGHIHINLFKPTKEIKKTFHKYRKTKFEPELIGTETGQLAKKMNKFTNENFQNYKHKNDYKYLSTNCNSFVKWILKQFPETKIKLPKTALGKNHK